MEKLVELLTEVSEVHHTVWAYQDGNDPEWALWYADWLVHHSDLNQLIGKEVTASEMTYLLVLADKQYNKDSGKTWQEYYAEVIMNSAV